MSAERLSKANLLIAVARDVYIRPSSVSERAARRLVPAPARIAGSAAQGRSPRAHRRSAVAGSARAAWQDDEPIRVRHVIARAQRVPGRRTSDVPLVSDTGDCLFAASTSARTKSSRRHTTRRWGLPFRRRSACRSRAGRRPLVLVGDGAFQMTGPEISHAPRYGCNPVIVLLQQHPLGDAAGVFSGRAATTRRCRGRLRGWRSCGADADSSRGRRTIARGAGGRLGRRLVRPDRGRLQPGDISPILRASCTRSRPGSIGRSKTSEPRASSCLGGQSTAFWSACTQSPIICTQMSADNAAPRIFVVDDEASVREFTERALQTAGYDVVAASNGKQALELVERRGPFDGFVVDVVMPGMSGSEWARICGVSTPTRRSSTSPDSPTDCSARSRRCGARSLRRKARVDQRASRGGVAAPSRRSSQRGQRAPQTLTVSSAA